MDEVKNKAPKVELRIWKDFFTYLKPYKKEFLKLTGIMAALGAMDSTFPLLSKYAVDNFIEKNSLDGLGGFIVIYILAVAILSGIIFVFIKLAGRLETSMAHDIRRIGFVRLQELSLSYYDDKAVGWLMARMTSDINRLKIGRAHV